MDDTTNAPDIVSRALPTAQPTGNRGIMIVGGLTTVLTVLVMLSLGLAVGAAAAFVVIVTTLLVLRRVNQHPDPADTAPVLVGITGDEIVFGTAGHGTVSRPLSTLTGVHVSVEPSSSTVIDLTAGECRLAGVRFLHLRFRSSVADDHRGNAVGDDAVRGNAVGGNPARYNVALSESDPAAAELVRRLRAAAAANGGALPPPASRMPTSSATPAGPSATPDTETAENADNTDADLALWTASTRIHGQVLLEYGAYELDPSLFLQFPAVTDVTREPVMDFHHALADVQALHTENYPGDPAFAQKYRDAVETLRRAWIRCERDGRAAGTSYLPAADDADLTRAAKLYRHALATDRDDERVAYLHKVTQTVADVTARGRVAPPAQTVAAIETQIRRALEPGDRASAD